MRKNRSCYDQTKMEEAENMTLGSILLSALTVLVLLGVGQRVLDKMHLSDRAALLIIGGMFVGGLLPDIDLGSVRINIGGALIPLGVCIYLLATADETKERVRALISALVTAGAVYALGRILPDEPETIVLDPVYICGLVGGVIGYIFGRSRRGAFISGVLGVLLADVINSLLVWSQGIQQTLRLGGAGIFDTAVISGLTAVLLAELLGETLERAARARGHAPDANRVHVPFERRKGEERE